MLAKILRNGLSGLSKKCLTNGLTHLLRKYHAFLLFPQISLQAQHHDWYVLSLPHIAIYHLLEPYMLEIDQAFSVANAVAQYYEIWPKESIVLWATCIVEFKSVGSIVHADIVDEWLV